MAFEVDSKGAEHSHTCYCFLWDTKPEHFERQGIPRGFCGTCGICGKFGHTRAHPNAPVTGSWCDSCYAELSKTTPLWKVVRFVFYAALFIWISYLLWRTAQ